GRAACARWPQIGKQASRGGSESRPYQSQAGVAYAPLEPPPDLPLARGRGIRFASAWRRGFNEVSQTRVVRLIRRTPPCTTTSRRLPLREWTTHPHPTPTRLRLLPRACCSRSSTCTPELRFCTCCSACSPATASGRCASRIRSATGCCCPPCPCSP